MTQAKVSAESVINTDVFRWLKRPARPGQTRVHRFALFLDPGDAEIERRCRAYWTLQERTYGLKLSGFSVVVNRTEQPFTVHTACVVERVLPGRRTADYSAVG